MIKIWPLLGWRHVFLISRTSIKESTFHRVQLRSSVTFGYPKTTSNIVSLRHIWLPWDHPFSQRPFYSSAAFFHSKVFTTRDLSCAWSLHSTIEIPTTDHPWSPPISYAASLCFTFITCNATQCGHLLTEAYFLASNPNKSALLIAAIKCTNRKNVKISPIPTASRTSFQSSVSRPTTLTTRKLLELFFAPFGFHKLIYNPDPWS